MPNYSDLITTIAQTTKAQEDALPVISEACRSQFFFRPTRPQRVCLFFHGFTAAPHQFVPMGKMFYQAGYTVLMPLLPGHGQAGNWSKTNPPPLPTDPQVYQQFALKWLEQAQAIGDQVIVGGLSGGGTMAAWLALERPQALYRVLLFAAYLSSSSRLLDQFVRMLDTYFEWQVADKPTRPDRGYGYKGFAVPALRTLLTMGSEILKRADRLTTATPPTFILSSERDIAVGNFDHQTLFEDFLKRQPITWYHRFSQALEVPHTMMTKADGNEWESCLNVMAKAFVESQLTWANVEEIGYRMTDGKPFNLVANELGLTAKASPDMPAMMTMVDKRAIVEKRNPHLRRRI